MTDAMDSKYEIEGEDSTEVRFAIDVLNENLERSADHSVKAVKCFRTAELLKARIDELRSQRPERERRTWWMRLPQDRQHGYLGIPDPNDPMYKDLTYEQAVAYGMPEGLSDARLFDAGWSWLRVNLEDPSTDIYRKRFRCKG